jgi:acetolactate synthase I/II/III large subunit
VGIHGQAADDLAAVRGALRAVPDGPFLLDAHIDPAGYRQLLSVSRG